jgi:hypothetical protein
MSFRSEYIAPAALQKTPTFGSKTVLTKSFVIDLTGVKSPWSGFTTATTYTVGVLPDAAQVVGGFMIVPTAVSGGTVSVATLAVAVNSQNVWSGVNVFTTQVGQVPNALSTYYPAGLETSTTGDQIITYTPTLTGSGGTAGIIYVVINYVI